MLHYHFKCYIITSVQNTPLLGNSNTVYFIPHTFYQPRLVACRHTALAPTPISPEYGFGTAYIVNVISCFTNSISCHYQWSDLSSALHINYQGWLQPRVFLHTQYVITIQHPSLCKDYLVQRKRILNNNIYKQDQVYIFNLYILPP